MNESPGPIVYILKCSDGTLYCGWTNDLKKRLREHNEGRNGAKYTRGRRPVKLVYQESCLTRSDALKREKEIQRLTRSQKLRLIQAAPA
jgi:putative endonuclease